MRTPMIIIISGALFSMAFTTGLSQTQTAVDEMPPQWIAFPDERLEMRGLPWFQENSPKLWRLPKHFKDQAPKGVWARAVAPDGGRIRFASDTTRLVLAAPGAGANGKPCFFDVYSGTEYLGSLNARRTGSVQAVVFQQKEKALRDFTIYLPNNREADFTRIGIDPGAVLKPAAPFALPKPLVCYGSSVLQGTGAGHPAKTYLAVVARALNLDFVNLGFGGSGRAESNVVALVNSIDACAFLFDLGKSYGAQTAEPYARMLDTIRASHPKAPIFVVTPIYSTKEASDPAYLDKSEKLRTLMRNAAHERIHAGDKHMHVIEGLWLFGEPDKAHMADPTHPNDDGNELMGQRLAPVLKRHLF